MGVVLFGIFTIITSVVLWLASEKPIGSLSIRKEIG